MASIFDILLNGTQSDVHVWSLPNVKGEGRERHIGTRDEGKIKRFVERRDEQGYGTFFCVSTIEPGEPRKKEHARELLFLFADVDFKHIALEPERITEIILEHLDLTPTRVHHTGNGLHCFWMLDAPVSMDGFERAEELLHRLANHVAGDIMVAHRVALLRVPGTHNSKRGEWHTVRVLREGREVYTLDQIDAWLTPAREPAMVRRNREENAFLRIGQEQAFRAPVDVQQRLAEMEIGGEGDRGVHQTQLSCTAALMNAGVEVEDAVALVLDATRELAGTEGWNWAVEERTIRTMCHDFLDKLEKRPRDIARDITPPRPQSLASALAPLINEQVVSLSEARKKRDEIQDEEPEPLTTREQRKKEALEKISKKQKNEHVVLGKGILASLYDEGRQIMYADNQCHMYRDGVWTAMNADEEKSWASVMVERGCNAHRLVSTTKIVNETRAWLQRHPDLHQEDVDWDGHGMIATASGLYDWKNDRIVRAEPGHYVTRRIDVKYVEQAICPVWEKMLKDDYGFDEPTVHFLQEFLGTCLVTNRPRNLRRALVLLGPSNTGKSNILNVMSGLISETTNPTPLTLIENSHGLMQFLKPNPWVLHEAFDQSRWEMSATVKALLSGDEVNVNVKNGPLVPLKFKQPVLWGTNVPPQFKEASRAMENRLAIVQMHRAFDPMRITGTAQEAVEKGYANPAEYVLDTEKEGLLQWAIDGLVRAMERGHFEFTEEMRRALHAMRTDSNMASGFIEECCEYDPNAYMRTADFYGAFKVWWMDHRGGTVPSVDSLGRAMSALSDPRVLTGRKISHHRVYAGLKMNGDGLDCWNAYSSSTVSERSGLRISDRVEEVNRELGAEQLQHGEFAALADAHRDWQPDGA